MRTLRSEVVRTINRGDFLEAVKLNDKLLAIVEKEGLDGALRRLLRHSLPNYTTLWASWNRQKSTLEWC